MICTISCLLILSCSKLKSIVDKFDFRNPSKLTTFVNRKKHNNMLKSLTNSPQNYVSNRTHFTGK